ncbi:MAG TPA: hypothetical protein VH249_20965 [Xanthobacteraceae bacterium]|jgi:hypothetical protein|nr:hypothetical protein [Xanthobacteraceae bacterium]
MLDNASEQATEGLRPDELAPRRSAKLAAINLPETSTAGKAEPPGEIVEYETAVKCRAASFSQLASAVFFSQEKFTSDPLGRAVYASYIAPLTEAFEASHGHITHSFYCERIIAAAVLTARHELWVIYPTPEAKEVATADILFECDRLNVEADRVLAGAGRLKDLQTTKILIYAVVTRLLSLLDTQTPPPRTILDLHWREARNAHDYYLRAAVRHAKFDYFLGMLIGAALCSVLVAVSALILTRHLSSPDATVRTLIGCLTAGGVGAVVSVMSRMTFGELTLDHEAGRRILTMLGAFRPVIGMVLGAAMWVLAASGVLAVGPKDPAQLPFFYILIAFLAGFSERWAQDMLGRAADQIGGSGAARRNFRRKGDRPSK